MLPSKFVTVEGKLSWMSVVVRHRLDTGAPHSHGNAAASVPLHIENTIGRPVAFSALLIVVYSWVSICWWVSPG